MLKYGFFNSVNGDRKYNADDISNFFLKLISDGVFADPASSLQVVANTGMTVSVNSGWAFIQCKWINNDSMYNITIEAADIALPRLDRVILRLNTTSEARCIELAVKKGTASSNPSAPALTRDLTNSGIYELSLATIRIDAGITQITQSLITDDRSNTSLCGYVTGLIEQIDTTDLFAQYNAAFFEWFDTIKDSLAAERLIRQYRQTYTTTVIDEEEVIIPFSNYNYDLDILNIYVNGVRLIENTEYTKSETKITLVNPLEIVGTQIEFELIKCLDTSGAETLVDKVEQIESQLSNSLIIKQSSETGKLDVYNNSGSKIGSLSLEE